MAVILSAALRDLHLSGLFKEKLVHPLISEVRGEGLFLAVRVVDPSYIPFIIAHAPDYGMVLDYFLFCNDAFRIAPPLIINDNQIADACSSLMRLLDAAENNFGKV